MAVRFTADGLQTYDPLQDFKKKASGVDTSKSKKCQKGYHWDAKKGQCIIDEKKGTTANLSKTGGKYTIGGIGEVSKREYDAYVARIPSSDRAGGRLTPRTEAALIKKNYIKDPQAEEKAMQAIGTPLEETEETLQPEITSPEVMQERGVLDIISEFAFGDPLAKDPITGKEKIDPVTGEPIKVLAGEVPLGLGGAASTIGAATKAGMLGKAVNKVKGAKNIAKATSIMDKLKNVVPWLLAAGTLGGVGAIVGIELFKDKAPFIQQSYNTLGELANSISSDVTQTGQQKLTQINFIQNQVNDIAASLQLQNLENLRLKNTKEMLDMQTDLFEKRIEILEAKRVAQLEVLQGKFPTTSEEVLIEWISEASKEEVDEVIKEYQKQIKILSR